MDFLTERQLEVLFAVIYEYITTGEPVGSRTIAKRYIKNASPATIRNEMADLESMGYFVQPHTSAGRVPTEKAYRLYVDYILKRKRHSIPPGILDRLNQLKQKKQDIEERLKCVTHMLSDLTSYVAIAGVREFEKAIFRKVTFVKLAERKIMAIIVMGKGFIHHKVFDLPYDMTQKELDDLAEKINVAFSGLKWSEMRKKLEDYLKKQLKDYEVACRMAIKSIDETLLAESRVFVGGIYNILNLPDFSDISRLKAILEIIEEESKLALLLDEVSKKKGINVLIGSEMPLEKMKGCSLLVATYNLGNSDGIIGVLGPTRMNYEKVIPILNIVAQGIFLNADEV